MARSDKLAQLEYMLRCKRDIILVEADDSPETQARLAELEQAIVRVNGNFHKAIAQERGV